MSTFLDRVEELLGCPAKDYVLTHPDECKKYLGMTPEEVLACPLCRDGGDGSSS